MAMSRLPNNFKTAAIKTFEVKIRDNKTFRLVDSFGETIKAGNICKRWWRGFASISARVESTLPDDFSYLYPLSFSGKWGLKWSESFKHKEQDQDNDHRYICMKGMCACVRIFVLFNASAVHGNVLPDYQK